MTSRHTCGHILERSLSSNLLLLSSFWGNKYTFRSDQLIKTRAGQDMSMNINYNNVFTVSKADLWHQNKSLLQSPSIWSRRNIASWGLEIQPWLGNKYKCFTCEIQYLFWWQIQSNPSETEQTEGYSQSKSTWKQQCSSSVSSSSPKTTRGYSR